MINIINEGWQPAESPVANRWGFIMDSDSQKLPLSQKVPIKCDWSVNRQLVPLASLVAGLVVFLFWLTTEARVSLFAALLIQ